MHYSWGGSISSKNVITHALTNSSKMTLKSDSFPFDPLKSQTLVIAPLKEPFLTSDREVRVSSEIGDSRPERGRIGIPFVNKHICSGDDAFTVQSDVGELDKLDIAVKRSLTNEKNTLSSQIEEVSLESIFPKIIKELNSSGRIKLVNSVLVQTPELVSFGHPPIQTDNVSHQSDGSVATRLVDQDRIQKTTDRDITTTPTHGDIETISEKLVYQKYIKDS